MKKSCLILLMCLLVSSLFATTKADISLFRDEQNIKICAQRLATTYNNTQLQQLFDDLISVIIGQGASDLFKQAVKEVIYWPADQETISALLVDEYSSRIFLNYIKTSILVAMML